MPEYTNNFTKAGYDMPTIARMTPEVCQVLLLPLLLLVMWLRITIIITAFSKVLFQWF